MNRYTLQQPWEILIFSNASGMLLNKCEFLRFEKSTYRESDAFSACIIGPFFVDQNGNNVTVNGEH